MTRPYEPPPPGPGFARFPPPLPKPLTAGQGWKLTGIVVAFALVGALVGLLVTAGMSTQYIGRAEIRYFLHVENASYFMRTDRNLSSQEVTLTDDSVLAPVAKANGLSTGVLAKKVTATIVDNTEVIHLDVLDPSRETGVTLANAIATQYLSVERAHSPAAAIQAQLDDAKRAAATAPAAGQVAAQAKVANLQGQLDIANTSLNSAIVLAPAYSVTAPASPNRMLAAGIGAFIGLLVALLVTRSLKRRWTAPPSQPMGAAPAPVTA
ncbi:hypothetical protein [Pseudonocardia spinosispora]|uniref:hypothetical protein n=1 Tax=Pseudonocardia spinosispora TaxID=103441 RepID=UPI0003F67B1C|nr:hypothetical protein [Pseudonocardia spinosispora]